MMAAPGPPLNPTPDEARQWLEEELSKAVYHSPESLLERAWRWLVELLGSSSGVDALPPWQALAIGLAALAIIVLVSWRLAGPLRRRALSRQARPVLANEERSAAELRAAAAARAEAADWRPACVMAFQALARRLEEREILDRQPGRTANELARDAALALPGLASALGRAAELFDAIAYGPARGDAPVYQFLADLDRRAEATKPARPSPPSAAGPPAGPPAGPMIAGATGLAPSALVGSMAGSPAGALAAAAPGSATRSAMP
ncbi:MAG: DUF4129 domain-containing protein [Bifidobacteriaceae bacterium]|jgi:hypothetical protein|nr:DUF4129 domain-containing protein [Bifidobacteriaceae bacterium]